MADEDAERRRAEREARRAARRAAEAGVTVTVCAAFA